jgi:calpain-15
VPCFSQPNGNELWALLLEKAFAKYCGSYENLENGYALFGWYVTTGCETLWDFNKSGSKFEHMEVSYNDRHVNSFTEKPGKEGMCTADHFEELLSDYSKQNYIMGASLNSDAADADAVNGLVGGHVYSIITVVKRDDRNASCRSEYDGSLILLRNPWGDDYEWNGDFSDKWSEWNKHPRTKKELAKLRPDWSGGSQSDGMFWMCYDDFIAHFDTVSVAAVNMGTFRGTNNTNHKAPKATCG